MDIVCHVAHERFSVADVNILEYRLGNCPLVPVPDHGRLKDYDQIMKEYNEWFSKAESREYESMFYALYRAISDSRTIIPGR